jgi:hypothetical protein
MRTPMQPQTSAGKLSKPRGNQARLSVAITLITLLTLAFAAAPAQAAVVHPFESKTTEEISKEAKTCSGPGKLTGPLHHVQNLAVDPGEVPGEKGHLWVAEERQVPEEGADRVDAFNDATGKCEGQLENASSLRKPFFGGVAVGHGTGEREVYGGVKEGGGGEDLVAVFGPSGGLQDVWSGAGTPVGSFAASAVNAELTGVAVDESPPVGDWASGDVVVALGGSSGSFVKFVGYASRTFPV